jgi:HPt (histidine-containing phosphotransfer) domain-containing protein
MIARLEGDEALVRQLVALFLDEYPRLVSRLRESVASGRAEDVRRAAHAAKGCIANFIETGPHQVALDIERAAAEARLDQVPPLMVRFERELAGLVVSMHAFDSGDRCTS